MKLIEKLKLDKLLRPQENVGIFNYIDIPTFLGTADDKLNYNNELYSSFGQREISAQYDYFIEIDSEENATKSMGYHLKAKYEHKWLTLYKAIVTDTYDALKNYDLTETHTTTLNTTETPNITHSYSNDETTTNNQTRGNTTTNTETRDLETSNIVEGNETGTTSRAENRKVSGFNSTELVDESSLSNTDTLSRGTNETNSGTDTGTITNSGTSNDTINSTNVIDGTSSHTETGTRDYEKNESNTITKSGNVGTTTYQELLERELEVRKHNFMDIVVRDVGLYCTTCVY